jgi:hypothetical protein
MDKTLYFEINNDSLALSTGEAVALRPKLVYGVENEGWSINILNDTAACDVSDADSWEAAVDKDFNPASVSGALTAGFTGAITSITADGFASAPPTTGFLVLTNGAGESDTIYYSAWSLNTGVYTFTVDVTLNYTYLNNDVARAMLTPPMCRILNANIDSSAAASGIIVVTMNSYTWPFYYAVVNSEEIAAYFELKRYVSGNLKYWFKFQIRACMQVDPGTGSPGSPATQFFTAAQCLSLFPPKYAFWTANINVKSTGDTTIFTVPAGYQFIPKNFFSICAAITGSGTAHKFKLKADSTELYTKQSAHAAAYDTDEDAINLGKAYAAGTIFKVNISTGSTFTTHTAKFVLEGIMIGSGSESGSLSGATFPIRFESPDGTIWTMTIDDAGAPAYTPTT